MGGKLENVKKWTCKTYRGASRSIGVSVWRIRYAVKSGYLSPPSVVLMRRALFSAEQVEEMRLFFQVEDALTMESRTGRKR